MHPVRAVFAVASLSFVAGCSHFGRNRSAPEANSDAAMAKTVVDLGIERKILQQELALARKEGDSLRTALDHSAGGASVPEVVARLNESARELATLRASYAKLSAERAAGTTAADPASGAKFSELENKLATSLRTYTQLQEENARLRTDLDRARNENVALASQLKTVVASNDQAQAALTQLNAELLAQKDARNRAEQATMAVRAQLSTVLAQGASAAPNRDASGTNPGTLQVAKAPPAGASAIAELRTDPGRVRESTPPGIKIHIIQAGDTLKNIARRYYNDPERWRALLEANTALLGDGRPLAPGMELRVPAP